MLHKTVASIVTYVLYLPGEISGYKDGKQIITRMSKMLS